MRGPPPWRRYDLQTAQSAPSAPQQEIQLRDYVRLVKKRWKLTLTVLLAVVAAVMTYSLLSPIVFQSKAVVQVQGQTGYVIRATSTIDDATGPLTPTSLTELVNSAPYEELATSLLTLGEGYNLDLTAYHSQDDMVRLFENELITRPLPAYFGRMALKTDRVTPAATVQGFGFTPEQVEEQVTGEPSNSLLASRLSSTQKDEAIKQAGALADLARHVNINMFTVPPEKINATAIQVMSSDLVRNLKSNPLRGKQWQVLSPLERGATVQAALREVVKKHPDDVDDDRSMERYATQELKETGMLNLFFEAGNPDRATQGADAMVDVVVWKNQYARKAEAQRYRLVTEYALRGSDGEGGVLGLLAQKDTEVRDLKKRYNLPDYEVAKEVRSKQLAQVQGDYQAASAEAAGAEKRVQMLTSQMGGIPRTIKSPTTAQNPTVSRFKTDLADAEAEYEAARSQFTDIHPYVQATRAKVERLREAARHESANSPKTEEVRESPNPVYEQFASAYSKAQADLAAAKAHKIVAEEQLVRAQAQLAGIPDKELGMSKPLRDSYLLTTDLKVLEEKYREAQLNEATKTSRASVVELAVEPGKKVKPKKTVNLVLSLLLGLFLGVAIAIFAESLDRTLRTRGELERALPGASVLATIPTFTADHPLIVRFQPRSVAAEAFRRLRSAIRFLGVQKPLQTMVVTSAGFAEGKSTVAANLAASMSQSGQRVILVDADLRKPDQHEIMGVSGQPGLTAVLTGEVRLDAALRPTDTDGLRLLPAGAAPPNPAELLDSQAMRRLMAELREQADVILFDAAPVGLVTDAAILSSLSDGALLVVSAGVTTPETLVRAHEALEQAHARLLGVVFNRADIAGGDSQYQLYQEYETRPATNGHAKSENRSKTKV